MIPMNSRERALAVDWFLEAMGHGGLTVFDADDMLARLRLAGDVRNLERLSHALSRRGGGHPAARDRPPPRPAPGRPPQ